MFEDIVRLVTYVQRHIDDPQSAHSLRSVAARVPMRSPSTGGSSGACMGIGWGGPTKEDNWRKSRDRTSTPGSRTGQLCRNIRCLTCFHCSVCVTVLLFLTL